MSRSLKTKLISIIILISFVIAGLFLNVNAMQSPGLPSSLFLANSNTIPPANGQTDTEHVDDIGEIQSVLQLLREEYIAELDPNKLLIGALYGLKDFLKLKKKDYSSIGNPISSQKTVEANMRAFAIEYSKIMMKYGGEFKGKELEYAALKGMTEVIQKANDDPYTVAMNADEYRILQEQLNSRGFSGIGVFIEMDTKTNSRIIVVEPIDGSPAQKAGIKPGDFIIRINGVSTRGMTLDNASSRIRGPEGSYVLLTIQRKGMKPFDVKVLRSNIVVNSLKWEMIGDIGYIKLRFFGDTTKEEFSNALTKLEEKGAKALVLDLRNNGGGYINAAVQVCSEFVKPGTVVTSVVNYRKGTKDNYTSIPSTHKTLPLAVLVNKYSASASEITAGCIQDLGLGVLIGTKTFGKGSVQTIHPISGGGAIKMTTAHYLTPKGKDINKKGIAPDILVEMDPIYIGGSKDIQLKRALSYVKEKISKK